MDIREYIEKQLGNLVLANLEMSVLLKSRETEIEKLKIQINELNSKLEQLSK